MLGKENVFDYMKEDLYNMGEYGFKLVINTQKAKQSKPK